MKYRSLFTGVTSALAILLTSLTLTTGAMAACVVGVSQYGDNYLSLRTGPGTRYQEIARMPNETNLRILERSGPWRRVRMDNGVTGWAHSRYIGSCGDGEGGGYGAIYHVAGLDPYGDGFLSLRRGPGTRYREIRRMWPDTIVTVLRSRGSWRYLRLDNGQQGWAHRRYLRRGYP